MALVQNISCTLSLEKDGDIIEFLRRQNEKGIKNSPLIKIALRNYIELMEGVKQYDTPKNDNVNNINSNNINNNVNNTNNELQENQPSAHTTQKRNMLNNFDFS